MAKPVIVKFGHDDGPKRIVGGELMRRNRITTDDAEWPYTYARVYWPDEHDSDLCGEFIGIAAEGKLLSKKESKAAMHNFGR